MELVKRKVLIEDLISRKSPINLKGKTISLGNGKCLVVDTREIILENDLNVDFNWGEIVQESFDINIFLTQNIDNIGIYLDVDYTEDEPNYQSLVNYSGGINTFLFNNINYSYDLEYLNIPKIYQTGFTFSIPPTHDSIFTGPYTTDQQLLYLLKGQTVGDYFFSGSTFITGYTDSKLTSMKTYQTSNPYVVLFNLNDNPSQYFTGLLSSGSTSISYTIDSLISNLNNTGIGYVDYSSKYKRTVYDDLFNINKIINITTFRSIPEGWNETNISLSALTKEEVDLGVVFPHEVYNDVFIDRGINSVLENQIRLSEIKTVQQFSRYGNGYYNVKIQS